MYSHQVYNSNGGLVAKIGLLLGQSWMVIPMNKYSPGISGMFIILTLACMLGHQSLGVCEVSDPYPL